MSKTEYTDRQKQLGEDIAFGMQQSVACLATDWIEAPINTRLQHWVGAKEHKSTNMQNLGGELFGSIGSLIAFIGLRQVFPQLFTGLKDVVRYFGDGFYDRKGRKSLKSWAKAHDIAEDSPEYQKKLAEWKDFQEESFAKASVMHAGNVAFNVIGQRSRFIGNEHSWGTLTATKLVSGLITPLVVLGFRLIVPKTAKKFDEELSERYFTPLVHKTQKILGAEETKVPASRHGLIADTDDDDDDKKKHSKSHKRRESHAEKIGERAAFPSLSQ